VEPGIKLFIESLTVAGINENAKDEKNGGEEQNKPQR